LLGYFYQPSEEPFIRDIVAAELSADACEVYADWLEEHSDSRAEFLRELAAFGPQHSKPSTSGEHWLNGIPVAWLHRICGSTKACRRRLKQWRQTSA
jgi:uncharacterized protein (TIGR02996 family)